ncbi:MAG: DNA polymerase III subunit gamma/tau [Candidatus Anaerobiospirillum merdipullorum]|uniref:DNA polymerase III subunit gamma/tau n=1 Tax=Candidatus Anaerobiospirillum merdipullorum TaxID=2838450 RepID=A0A9E2KL90_9GAMM|nr:DNA polymerase III subunit gamma/tau [Candidatus Anaerobiospirillum merdipullorum]
MALALTGEYQALARKYRPQTFDDVVGQKHVLGALSNAIDSKRIHHAYLLTGTRGIGKTTIARIIAKCLECEQGISAHPCGHCAACEGIAKGAYPDVIEIDAASQTKVDDTRQLLENTQYPPVTGRYKIYIIDEVHMLSQSSFNALLKTLEEPPSYVKFILATTDPHKIPTTVLSRCLQFQLKALTHDEIASQIIKIAQNEQIPCENEAAQLIARAAKGSMRDALSLTDQAIALGGGKIAREAVLSMLGSAGDSLLLAILDSLLPQSKLTLEALLADIAAVSPNYRTLLEELALALHDVALFQFIGGSKLNVFSLPVNLLEQYAPRFGAQDLQLYYQICLEGLREYEYAPDGKSAFEMTVLRLHAFSPEKKKKIG